VGPHDPEEQDNQPKSNLHDNLPVAKNFKFSIIVQLVLILFLSIFCYRYGLHGHFAQYCVSVMPEDIRHRIIHNREHQAQLADDESSDSDRGAATAFTTNSHIAAAAVDLLLEVNIDMMDPLIRESMFGAYAVPYPLSSPFVDQPPAPLSPTLTASFSSVAGTPKKKKEVEEKEEKRHNKRS
jgi:hypothetical protein